MGGMKGEWKDTGKKTREWGWKGKERDDEVRGKTWVVREEWREELREDGEDEDKEGGREKVIE